MTAAVTPGTAAPSSPRELFTTYCAISAQAFGGSLALTERTLVHGKRWLTAQEFLGVYAISQALPGPTGVSFCVLVGDRFFGLKGACAALAGFVALPTVLVIALAALFQQFQHLALVQGVLHGMGAAAVGLILHTAARMSRALRGEWIGIGVAVVACAMVAIAGLSVRIVLLTVGLASVAWAWHRLGRPR